jgi:hypothetical protein
LLQGLGGKDAYAVIREQHIADAENQHFRHPGSIRAAGGLGKTGEAGFFDMSRSVA